MQIIPPGHDQIHRDAMARKQHYYVPFYGYHGAYYGEYGGYRPYALSIPTQR
jgi:hypothetical protein